MKNKLHGAKIKENPISHPGKNYSMASFVQNIKPNIVNSVG